MTPQSVSTRDELRNLKSFDQKSMRFSLRTLMIAIVAIGVVLIVLRPLLQEATQMTSSHPSGRAKGT
jgi:hypothetical protein